MHSTESEHSYLIFVSLLGYNMECFLKTLDLQVLSTWASSKLQPDISVAVSALPQNYE